MRGRGGTYYRALHLGRQLARRGHAVSLVTVSARARRGFNESEQDGVRIIESPDLLPGRARTGWDPSDAFRRGRRLAREGWDVVHAFDSRPAVVLPALRLQRRGIPLVMDWADWWGRGGTQAERPGRVVRLLYGPLETYFEERFRTRADATTVISKLLRERAISLGVPAASIRLLPGGCNPDLVAPVERKAAQAALGLAGSPFTVGFMGAAAVGDLDLLFAAFRVLRRRVPEARLLTVGVNVAGSGLSFERLVPDDLRPALDIFGFTPLEKLSAYLGACDVLALPLRDSLANRARWPSRIGDYLAAGRPVVASPVSDICDLFDNEIGQLARTDEESFGEALARLAAEPDAARRFGRNARALAEGVLSWASLAGGMEELYQHVLEESRPSARSVAAAAR